MCQHKTNVHKVSGAFPPTGRDRRAGTTFALPEGLGQHAIDVPPARHRRDTSSLALCVDVTTKKFECLSHRYGTSCTRKGCVYRHPPKPPKKVHVPKTSEICVHYVSGCCSFAERASHAAPGQGGGKGVPRDVLPSRVGSGSTAQPELSL